MIVHLAETRVSTGDLLNLRVGDVITTHQSVNSPLAVRVGGVTKFHGRPGALQGHKAVRIEEPQ